MESAVMERSIGRSLECNGKKLDGAGESGTRIVVPLRGEWFQRGRQRVSLVQVGNLLHGCLRTSAPLGDRVLVHPAVRGGGFGHRHRRYRTRPLGRFL